MLRTIMRTLLPSIPMMSMQVFRPEGIPLCMSFYGGRDCRVPPHLSTGVVLSINKSSLYTSE